MPYAEGNALSKTTMTNYLFPNTLRQRVKTYTSVIIILN